MQNDIIQFPETLVFIGAGATASLGMPQTDAQSKFFRALAERKMENSLEDVLSGSGSKKIFGQTPSFQDRDLEIMAAFIKFLGDDVSKDLNVVRDEDMENARVVFDGEADESLLKTRVMELRREYDWKALKQIIGVCPYDSEEDNLMRDVYTMIDMKIRDRQGIKVGEKDGEPIIIEPGRLPKARNCLVLFTNILFANVWYNLSKENRSKNLQKYMDFMETVARIVQKEGDLFASRGYEFKSPLFYQSSVAMVSLNFETVFLWLLFNANKKVNYSGFYLQQTAQELKVWLEFGVRSMRRNISKGKGARKANSFVYSQDEASVSRNNAIENAAIKVGRISKFLFAHGCCNWRECPSCGRMMYYLGDEWGFSSKHVNPPFPIALFENNDFNRTPKEEKWKSSLRYDSLECISCGAETISSNAPMIMQTMVKGIPTSFLDEVQRESKVLLRKARHIVLFGYQLPPDDVLWQEAFAESVCSRRDTDNYAYCSVVVGHLGEKRWLYGEELTEFVEKYRYTKDAAARGVKAIVNAVAVFGKDNVRAYTGGIPDVWGNASESEVRELLYPDHWVNWKGTRLA